MEDGSRSPRRMEISTVSDDEEDEWPRGFSGVDSPKKKVSTSDVASQTTDGNAEVENFRTQLLQEIDTLRALNEALGEDLTEKDTQIAVLNEELIATKQQNEVLRDTQTAILTEFNEQAVASEALKASNQTMTGLNLRSRLATLAASAATTLQQKGGAVAASAAAALHRQQALDEDEAQTLAVGQQSRGLHDEGHGDPDESVLASPFRTPFAPPSHRDGGACAPPSI